MPTFVLGDVHARYDALQRLLDRVEFEPDRDRLWSVGDLVNRGPDSVAVLRWAREHGERMGGRFVSVLGNHDLALLAVAAGVRKPRSGWAAGGVLEAPDRDELLDWLGRRPLLHREGPYLLVHAGLWPEWDLAAAEGRARRLEVELRGPGPGSLLELPSLPALRPGSPDFDLAVLTRMRTVNGSRLVDYSGPPEKRPDGATPWYEVAHRRPSDLTVLFGHWAALGLRFLDGAVALDSGAAWNGALSLLDLDTGVVHQEPVRAAADGRTGP